MANFNNYHVSAADWRKQLRLNERRTKIVITLFVLLYLLVGFLIDLVWHSQTLYLVQGVPRQLPLSTIAYALVTLQIFPIATVIAAIVAVISLFITYSMHDKIVMLGTSYQEVTAHSNNLEAKQLYNVVEEMKVAAGLKYMPRVFIIEADYMNAFASGYSEKSALVAITRGLLMKLDRAELQAVMAHELSHIRHHDIKLTLTATVLSNIMLIAIDLLFWRMIFSRDSRENNKLVIIVLILRYLLPLITMMLMLYLSRTREYMADAGCVELMRDNEPLARALMKIHNDHRENQATYSAAYASTPHEEVRRAAYLYDPTHAGLRSSMAMNSAFSTHPSLQQRLKAIGFSKK